MSRSSNRALIGLLSLAALLAAGGAGASSAAQPRVSVYFLQGEQLAKVSRRGSTPLDAVRLLIAGPTRAEVARGFRTYLPAGTRVHSVTVTGRVATVDLNERFAAGKDTASLLARLAQLVRTLTGLQGATKVQLLMDGAVAAARFPAEAECARSEAAAAEASLSRSGGEGSAAALDRAGVSPERRR